LISAPILGYANFEIPFEIHTDASGTALGAVLYQEQDGFKKVISVRHQISEWFADMAELSDKSSVVTNKSKETSDIFRVGRFWPIYYFLRFGWINLDVIIFGKTYEEHLDNLCLVFNRIRQYNMKLAPEKCSFFTRKVKYVGHVVSEAGVEVDPAKTEKVVNWPKPTNPEDVAFC
jgi:hypothetical protein